MDRRDLVLAAGGFVIGSVAFYMWRDFWGTAITIVIGCLLWVAAFRSVEVHRGQ